MHAISHYSSLFPFAGATMNKAITTTESQTTTTKERSLEICFYHQQLSVRVVPTYKTYYTL